jgi:hypothetical protein
MFPSSFAIFDGPERVSLLSMCAVGGNSNVKSGALREGENSISGSWREMVNSSIEVARLTVLLAVCLNSFYVGATFLARGSQWSGFDFAAIIPRPLRRVNQRAFGISVF